MTDSQRSLEKKVEEIDVSLVTAIPGVAMICILCFLYEKIAIFIKGSSNGTWTFFILLGIVLVLALHVSIIVKTTLQESLVVCLLQF